MAKKSTSKSETANSDLKFERQDFDIFGALDAIDRKDYDYFDRLTPEQQRKFVPYMMLHWASAAQAKSNIAGYYVMSVNHYANVNMFNEYVQSHPKLQWMMLCASSPGLGKFRHAWIPHLSPKITQLREPAKSKDVATYFGKIYPSADAATLNEVSQSYTEQQNHCHKLAQIYPHMKQEDIQLLAQLVSPQDVVEYEKESGN